MSDISKNVRDTLQELRECVDYFYQQKNQDALQKLELVLGKMQYVIDMLFSYQQEKSTLELDENRIMNILKNALDALEGGDYILLADIIQYDFVDYMEELVSTIE